MKSHLWRSSVAPVVGLILVASLAPSAWAKNPIRQAFFQTYPFATNTVLDSVPSRTTHCGVCHFDFSGGGARNPYGLAVEANLSQGNSNAVWLARLVDSDTDGYLNLAEITNRLSGIAKPTFPGLKAGNTNQVSNVNLGDIAAWLTPGAAADTTPPTVALLFPNGGQVITANRWTNITWTATDASGVTSVALLLSLDNGGTYSPLVQGLPNTGNYAWVPADRPTAQARIKVEARDAVGNLANDASDGVFTIESPLFTNTHGVATTLRDFDMPGTQPFEHGPDLDASANCASCHGNYNAAVEPWSNWQGSMMAHAARDPLFKANLAIANQDAANSGDLCLRCHFPRGWLAGRSVPTDGSRMTSADADGVTCALCHRMVDPVYQAGVSPTNDLAILAALSFKGTNYGNGMYVVDPTGLRRGPYSDSTLGHDALGSAFHRSAAFCGTCHDVSNPAFTKDGNGIYQPNTFDAPAATFSPHFIAPVERTYSEWLASDYNTPTGVYAPQFAGNRPNGRVSTCQHCHMQSIAGYAAATNTNPGIPLRSDMGLHDMTGGSTWVAGLLTNLFPGEVSVAAVQAGINRATSLLQNAATLAVGDAGAQLKVTVTNECGHKLPTGYPEGRRVWLNVKFFNEANQPVGESGAYNFATGELTRDAAKIYEVHPGIDTNISGLLGLDPDASLHFVLNNKIYEDNRIPPRGFTNTTFAAFGGEPVGHPYADGQYWDDTLYALPTGAVRAEVKLYYQSTSKEFIEFLRDENRTTADGQAMYNLWATNGMCPPTLMQERTWHVAFQMKSAQFTPQGKFRMEFLARPGTSYTVEFKNSLDETTWQTFVAHGTLTTTTTAGMFEDDFTANSSGSVSPTGQRYYRFRYVTP
jgi:hypothetical protein